LENLLKNIFLFKILVLRDYNRLEPVFIKEFKIRPSDGNINIKINKIPNLFRFEIFESFVKKAIVIYFLKN